MWRSENVVSIRSRAATHISRHETENNTRTESFSVHQASALLPCVTQPHANMFLIKFLKTDPCSRLRLTNSAPLAACTSGPRHSGGGGQGTLFEKFNLLSAISRTQWAAQPPRRKELIIVAIKSLLTPLKRFIVWNAFRSPQLWEKRDEFLYHNIIKNLWTFFSVPFLPISRRRAGEKKFSQVFLLHSAEGKKSFFLQEIKTRGGGSWNGARRGEMIINKKLFGMEHKAFPRKSEARRIVLCR